MFVRDFYFEICVLYCSSRLVSQNIPSVGIQPGLHIQGSCYLQGQNTVDAFKDKLKKKKKEKKKKKKKEKKLQTEAETET